MLPLSLLKTAQNHPMLVELKNGETYNGHLVSCDNWMNINLREVICTSRDGDKFWRMPECYIRGSTIKYLRIPDEIIDMVKEEVVSKGRGRGGMQQQKQQKGRGVGGAGRVSLPWFLFPEEECSVAVAEESQAVEEGSRKRSRAGNQRSSEGLPQPGQGQCCSALHFYHLRIAMSSKVFYFHPSVSRSVPESCRNLI
ncbi:UNVERIFIED_CONTAM: hypothetical protein H355_012047 [Colinus virginianus]|nr:hypothetical protein H355_012047 [Colinus virginianus]